MEQVWAVNTTHELPERVEAGLSYSGGREVGS